MDKQGTTGNLSTDSKEVALYFLEKTKQNLHKDKMKSFMARTVPQIKRLLCFGYTRDDLVNTIDYIQDKTKTNMYSFGYVVAVIEDLLPKVQADIEKDMIKQLPKEVNYGAEQVKENNRRKRGRNTGFQSRIREKFTSDLFEE